MPAFSVPLFFMADPPILEVNVSTRPDEFGYGHHADSLTA